MISYNTKKDMLNKNTNKVVGSPFLSHNKCAVGVIIWIDSITVKPVKNAHSKIDKTKIFSL